MKEAGQQRNRAGLTVDAGADSREASIAAKDIGDLKKKTPKDGLETTGTDWIRKRIAIEVMDMVLA